MATAILNPSTEGDQVLSSLGSKVNNVMCLPVTHPLA